jgi:hypothetical protein
MWNASMASGYGHVQRYRQRGRLIVVVKTSGLVVVDRDADERWLLRDCFQHGCAAFAPSGQWLLVVGDETLYALTLGDHVLRRLVTVPGVLDVVEHPDGFLLLGTDSATLVDATMLDAVVQRAPEVARLVVEKCSS